MCTACFKCHHTYIYTYIHSNLFFALKDIYGFAVCLALLLHATAAQQNFCSYSQMAAISPPFSPCCTCSLSADSRVISGGTLLSPAQCERRGSKSSLWLSNQICAVPGEYREAERNRKAHYQYYLNRIKRQCGHGVTQGKKRAFPCGFSTENEVRIPLNAASGMCSRVKCRIPQLYAAKLN